MEYLLYGGILMMAASVVIGIVRGVMLFISGKKLEEQLNKEFGERKT